MTEDQPLDVLVHAEAPGGGPLAGLAAPCSRPAVQWPAASGQRRENAREKARAFPPGVTASGGISTGKAGAAHSVVIYQHDQCPCGKAFEASAGSWLEKERDAGAMRLEYQPIAFLDASSEGNTYSTRAANAAFCVAQERTVDFSAWNDAMYAQQPAEGTDGRTDSELLAVATKLGAGAAARRCIAGGRYGDWVAHQTASAMSAHGANITGTPTVLVDGKRVSGAGGTIPSLAQVQSALGTGGQ